MSRLLTDDDLAEIMIRIPDNFSGPLYAHIDALPEQLAAEVRR